MVFFIDKISKKSIAVRARAESEDGDMVGDLIQEVEPGESFGGYSFDQLYQMGTGQHKSKDKT